MHPATRMRNPRSPEAALAVGAREQDGAFTSDLERALLDAAARPELVGGIAVLTEALGAAAYKAVDAARLTNYARLLSWGLPVRYVGHRGLGRTSRAPSQAEQ